MEETFCGCESEHDVQAIDMITLLGSTRASTLHALEQHSKFIRIEFQLSVVHHCTVQSVSGWIRDGSLGSEQCKIVRLTSPAACESCSSKNTTTSALSRSELHIESAGDERSLLEVSSLNDL